MNFKNFMERKKIINRNIRIEKEKKEKLRIKKISKKEKKKNRKNNPK